MMRTEELTKQLVETSKITRGRVDTRTVFRDFISYCALKISTLFDPAHPEREKHLQELLGRYRESEQTVFAQTFEQLTETVVQNVECGLYEELFHHAFYEVKAANREMKQDFTPPSIAKLLAQIACGDDIKLPEAGFFTLTDPACGSGVLLLTAAEHLKNCGFNPSAQLVVQAVDLDLTCVQMTYIHLSLYGIPAVVIRGNTLTLQEYDRWYTPVYRWGKWVWRVPLPFGDGGKACDEKLKMIDEPMYAACRQVDQLFKEAV